MDHDFDPRRLPDGGKSFAPALELCAALALLDGDFPRAWRRCRGAALRYVEVVRVGRFSARVALDLLRRAVETWTPGTLDPTRRARLDSRLPFWVGTAYGLRWQAEPARAELARAEPARAEPALAEPALDESAAADEHAGTAGAVLPGALPGALPVTMAGLLAGALDQLQERRAALVAQRMALRARREALAAALAETQARTWALCDASVDRIFTSSRIHEAERTRPATPRRHCWAAVAAGTLAVARPVVRRMALRLTDEAILEIARRIRRAMHQPRPDDPRDDILARHHELSAEDEGRVEAALRRLHETEEG